uniref:uncharacterized protein LOC105353328 n=1 Tax=Fragaria vesca subsp. vesca TaxID=101020 RepID=UPI0005C8D743|nr:PREDICTED: uncharacterized protein LOC105353328 [Fragaria vesca subsp. vesca]
MIRKSQEEDEEDDLATSAVVIAAVAHHNAKNQPRSRGSHPGRHPNQPREREDRGKGILQDYFVPRPIFSDEEFRVRYRMSHGVFNRICGDLCNHDRYFVHKLDATKTVGLLPEQKMTSSLRMFVYGAAVDQCAEYCRMAKSTSIECLQRFTRGIVALYSAEYLRAPTPADRRRLLAKGERRGFPGMIGSIDFEDKRPEDSDDDLESDEEEENNMRPRVAEVWDGPTGQDFDPVGRDVHRFEGFMERYNAIRNQNDHLNLQEDLIEHLWEVQGNMEI